MESVGYILLCCVLFVHLGLGDAVAKVIRRNLSLFSCVKCFTFWTILAYTLFFEFEPIKCIAVAFVCSYLALWADLVLSKIAVIYETWYKGVVAEELDSTDRDKENKSETR